MTFLIHTRISLLHNQNIIFHSLQESSIRLLYTRITYIRNFPYKMWNVELILKFVQYERGMDIYISFGNSRYLDGGVPVHANVWLRESEEWDGTIENVSLLRVCLCVRLEIHCWWLFMTRTSRTQFIVNPYKPDKGAKKQPFSRNKRGYYIHSSDGVISLKSEMKATSYLWT